MQTESFVGLKLLLVAAYALTRLGEWRRHRLNLRDLLAADVREVVPEATRQYYAATFLAVPLMLAEAYASGGGVVDRRLFCAGVLALSAGFALRASAIVSLGRWWTMRCLVHPGLRALRVGPYRFLKHPEYCARMMEVFGLAVVLAAPWTGLASGLVLWLAARRIAAVELSALAGAHR